MDRLYIRQIVAVQDNSIYEEEDMSEHSMEELHHLQSEVDRLEREKHDREVDEAIGTTAGILTVVLFALLGGVLWGINKLSGGALWAFAEKYIVESFWGGLSGALFATVVFTVIGILVILGISAIIVGSARK